METSSSVRRSLVALAVLGCALSLGAPAYADPPAAAPAPPSPAAKAEATKLSDAFVSVANSVSPSVVQIEVTARDEDAETISRLFGKSQDSPIAHGLGSGVIYTSDGAILTNNHVIDHALSINVRLRDGRLVAAKLVGRDPGTDLAVVKIDAPGLTPAKMADSDAARVGEWVVAIGSPFALSYTVTTGVLSAKGRNGLGMNEIEDFLQTDASINPGNSGGPLADLDGRVLGINTMIVGKAQGGSIGFVIPSNMAKRVADQLLKNGRVQRAWIGVGIQDLTPELAGAMKVDPRAGALVNQVNDAGPAHKANLKPGDIIAAVGGKRVTDGSELRREVLQHDVGTNVALEIIRDGKRYQTSLSLTARPEPAVPPLPVQQQGAPQSGLGLTVRDLAPSQSAQLGLPPKPLPVVTSIAPGSAADRAGLKGGDVIIEADGVQDPSSNQLADAAKDGQVLVRVKRRDATFYAAMKK